MDARTAANAAQARQDPLVALYGAAWERIQAEVRKLEGRPQRTARVTFLNNLRAFVNNELDRLDSAAAALFQRIGHLPYLDGARFVDALPTNEHLFMARRLAGDTFDDLLSATNYVRYDTKRLIREAARIAAESTFVDRTAPQAGRDMMQALLRDHGLHAVTYRNGTRHGLGEYSNMVLRTKTATYFNQGALDGAPDVEWWECFDGPNCGLTAHDDINLANGLIRTRDEARAYPTSHPNCRRSWGPRPDVGSKTAARRAQGKKADRMADALHSVGG